MFIIVSFISPMLKLLVWYIYSTFYCSSSVGDKEKTLMHRLLEFAVIPLLRPVLDDIPSNMPMLFDRRRFVVRISTAFSILVTYGVAFAPLAVVIACGIFSVTYFEQLLVGRLLTLEMDMRETNQMRSRTYRQILNREVEGINDILVHMVWVVAPFVSIFYSFFIFDTLGSAVGWKDAIMASVLMTCTPLLIWAAVKTYFLFVSEEIRSSSNPLGSMLGWSFDKHSGVNESRGHDRSSIELRMSSMNNVDNTTIMGTDVYNRWSVTNPLASSTSTQSTNKTDAEGNSDGTRSIDSPLQNGDPAIDGSKEF